MSAFVHGDNILKKEHPQTPKMYENMAENFQSSICVKFVQSMKNGKLPI